MLDSLEHARESLARLFPRTVAEVTVVMHDSSASLMASNPLLGLSWAATAPASRRYLAGWVSRDEIHVLAPTVLAKRASAVPGSAQMLALAPVSLYTQRVIIECNHELHSARLVARLPLQLRWAWLLEGGARYFSGETGHARGAIARRLHEGGHPHFPPRWPDATLLGGTVIDLLAREMGELAAAQFACRLHPDGPHAALTKAFGGRPLVHSEGAWRSHLARLAGSGRIPSGFA